MPYFLLKAWNCNLAWIFFLQKGGIGFKGVEQG